MNPFQITRQVIPILSALHFSAPVTHVYNPLEYAGCAHQLYLEHFGQGSKPIILVGMNPGPWGMAQTGVPFGDVVFVREWMKISCEIQKPTAENPKRPITGFQCTRREISGSRLWGWAQSNFKTAHRFFTNFFVVNYCPLIFMELSGKNRTPDKLPAGEKKILEAVCDRYILDLLKYYQPKYVIGVGGFAGKATARLSIGQPWITGCIPHPSPANPLANKGWASAALNALEACIPDFAVKYLPNLV